MTILEAKKEAAKIGMMIRRTGEGKELRVNFIGGGENTAYYTDNIEDALGTARAMKAQDDKNWEAILEMEKLTVYNEDNMEYPYFPCDNIIAE